MEDYTIYCTPKQTRNAFVLGAPIEFKETTVYDCSTGELIPYPDIAMDKDGEPILITPTAEQMIGWLRTRGIKFLFDDATSHWRISYDSVIISYGWTQDKELAAIDAALEYIGI